LAINLLKSLKHKGKIKMIIAMIVIMIMNFSLATANVPFIVQDPTRW